MLGASTLTSYSLGYTSGFDTSACVFSLGYGLAVSVAFGESVVTYTATLASMSSGHGLAESGLVASTVGVDGLASA